MSPDISYQFSVHLLLRISAHAIARSPLFWRHFFAWLVACSHRTSLLVNSLQPSTEFVYHAQVAVQVWGMQLLWQQVEIHSLTRYP
jgi:hypothetical protein